MSDLRVLSQDEIGQVSGGFICGGLCMAGSFVVGAAIGGGISHWALSR